MAFSIISCLFLSFLESALCASNTKQLLTFLHGVIRSIDGVPYGSGIGKDLIVIAPLVRLVTKEVDFVVLLLADVIQAVRLVPALGHDIKRNLTADAESQVISLEALLHSRHHCGPDLVLLVVLLKGVSLLPGAASPNRTHVQHPRAELHKGAPFHWNVDICHVAQDPIDDFLQLVFSQMLHNRLFTNKFTSLVGHQTVL
mmetsp:Transcript_6886/g.10393  ORF Transcript_6886/g.10393 Transcript_6886/m.10393 type:complete len:200 (+) Transcript_6886:168-767(+)